MIKKQRIAHLIYSKRVGGSEMMAANLCSLLDRTHYEPVLLSLYPGGNKMDEIASHMQIPFYEYNLSRINKPFKRLLLPRFLKGLSIDILHVHHVALYSTVASSLPEAGLKGVVLTEHAYYSISKSAKLQQAARRAILHTDRFTVVSKSLKKYFVENLELPDDKLQVIENGIDTDKFSPAKEPVTLTDIVPKTFHGKVFITVGRLAEAKDHATLFKAASILKTKRKSFYIIVVGEGELMNSLQQRKQELGLDEHVALVGTRLDIPRLLQGADFFVLSSMREGLPMVVLEAMSAGLPLIATEVGGIGEVVTHGKDGLLVPAEDPEQLADAMEKLIDDNRFASALGAHARKKIVANYSLEIIAEQYMQIYQTLLQKKHL